jgi:hypothetical protein
MLSYLKNLNKHYMMVKWGLIVKTRSKTEAMMKYSWMVLIYSQLHATQSISLASMKLSLSLNQRSI